MEDLFSGLSAWHLWVGAGILLFIVEIFTPAFLAGALGLGCFAAGIGAAAGLDLDMQIVVFCVATIIVFVGVRPFVRKYIARSTNEVRTNADALIGKTARVIERIDNNLDNGRVLVFGDNWRARTEEALIVEEGAQVEILRIEGTTLIVKPTR